MKKLLLVLVGLCVISGPARAAMNFYRGANGQLVLEATDCNSASRLLELVLPDDPPGGTESEDDPPGKEDTQQDDPAATDPETGDPPEGTQNDDSPAEETDPSAASKIDPAGVQTLIEAIISSDEDLQSQSFHGVSSQVEDLLDEASFEEWQDSFITFVRDVNWKTGMYMTFRDYSFFRRLKMACAGINQMTKPLRLNLETYTGSLDQTLEKTTDAGVNKLAQAARGHSFDAMSKLSVFGLAIAIEKENPFLLLAMDEETYNKLIEVEPKIAKLFEDMYTFFAIRSVRMGDYNSNIKALIDITKLGKGDAFNTWHVLAEYAKKMLELDRQDKLCPEDEKNIHIWRLESSMRYVREQVRVERRAAEIAIKDPQNASLVKEVSEGPKKKPSLDDKARELLQKSTQDEIKHLIRKYKGK